jgi:hypothetical protein
MKKLLAIIVITAVISVMGTLGIVNYTQPTTEVAMVSEWTVRGDYNCNGRIDYDDVVEFGLAVIDYTELSC